MECPTCFEVYTSSDKSPRNLECGHTFCETCLTRLHTESRIVCPTCRKLTFAEDPRELPQNFIAASLAAKYHEDKRRVSLCVAHPYEPVRFFCNSCDLPICVQCMISHSGHCFVKYEESSKVLLKLAAGLAQRLKHSLFVNMSLQDQTEQHVLDIDTKQSQTATFLQRLYSDLSFQLTHKQDRLKDAFTNAVSSQASQIRKRQAKLHEVDSVILQTRQSLNELISKIQTMSDSDVEGGLIAELLFKIREQTESLDASIAKFPALAVASPLLKTDPAVFQTIKALGAVVPGSPKNMGRPFLCFFGDKHKVMSFDIERSAWEIKPLHSQAELNYYAAAASLQDGSALITGGGSSNAVFLYQDRKIVAKPGMIRIRKEHAAVCLNRFVYVMGGYDGLSNQFLAECERFNVQSDVWEPVSMMNRARCAFSATVVNSRMIYVFGGYDGHNRLATIEKYSYELDRWELINYTLRFPLSNCACFSPQYNKVVVLGGGFSSGFSLAVDMFDVETGEWVSLPMMTEGRDLRNKICHYEGEAYCVGGYNFKAEKLNVAARKWVQLPNYLASDNLDSWACALTFRSLH